MILSGLFLASNLFADSAPEMVVDAVGKYDAVNIPKGSPALAMAVAMNEMAERELIKHFRHFGTWLTRVPSKNKWVNNNVIKLNEIGADPNVLVNNNTYPIPVAARPDDSVAISLYKYDTENTKVTDDELYALPYDKIGSVQQQHRETLEERTREHALHSLAPATNSAETPIIRTTGAVVNGRKRLIYDDLVNFKKALDDLKIPKTGRVLVLCSNHIQDLLLEDKILQNQYQNHTDGAIAKKYVGFEIYEDVYNPKYENTGLTKVPFGAAGTDPVNASTFFLAQRTAKARGTVSRYMRDAKIDPENRESVIGFRLYMVVIPISKLGQGAIVDAKA